MKNLVLISMFVSMLVLTFSCKKDDKAAAGNSLSAKVEGTLWTSTVVMASHSTAANLTSIIAAGNSATEQIGLNFVGAATGTYHLGDSNMGMASVGNKTFSSLMSDAPVGEIVITKYDATKMLISGTFSFKGEDIDGTVYNVTEGSFNDVTLTIN